MTIAPVSDEQDIIIAKKSAHNLPEPTPYVILAVRASLRWLTSYTLAFRLAVPSMSVIMDERYPGRHRRIPVHMRAEDQNGKGE